MKRTRDVIERFARVYRRYCRNVFMNFLNVHLGPYHALSAASNTEIYGPLKTKIEKKQKKKKERKNMNKQSEPYHADNYVL